MNPLKLRLPDTTEADTTLAAPGPQEIQSWLHSLKEQSARKAGPAMQGLLHGLNTREIPVLQRLHTLSLLQYKVYETVSGLRSHYRSHPLPLNDKVRPYANLALQLVSEMAAGYKLIVNEAICHSDDDGLDNNMFLVALRQAIEGLGQHLLECNIQYLPVPVGHWGELHRLFQFADRNGLSTLSMNPVFGNQRELTTIQHAYLRVAMLGLTQPNHLMTSQAEMIYGYLEQWTVGCRLERRKDTLASPGDMFVDLAGDNSPMIATSYTRFRPVDGRFFDITYLQTRLREMRGRLEIDTEKTLTLEERMRRDMLARLYSAWEGRGERESTRDSDGETPVLTSIGLGAAHHFINDEQDYLPEQDEIQHLKPWKSAQDHDNPDSLSLQTSGDNDSTIHHLSPGLKTRVSHFEVDNDVWTTMHNRDLNAREQRQATLDKFMVEGWKRINHSRGGLALTRNKPSRTQLQVGSLAAFRDDRDSDAWRIGVIRWVQNNGTEGFDIGIMALADTAKPVAVRAIAGAGAGGEYFRSLQLTHDQDQPQQTLAVPAHIYDIHSQLVLNHQKGIEFVQLTRLIETTPTFSLFSYQKMDLSIADYQKIMKTQARKKQP